MNREKSQKGKVFVLSGPSGSGKTTLHKQLLKNKALSKRMIKTISVTTREKRFGEKNGKDYLFFTKKMFFYRRETGYFLEWKKVFDHYYGTPKKKVEDLLKKGKNVLLCIDVKGAKEVFKKNPSAIGIFVKTPTFEILKKRLEKRNSEKRQDLKKRLRVARQELKEEKKYKYVIMNDVLSRATKKLERVVSSELKILKN